jgi:hypothetical protein
LAIVALSGVSLLATAFSGAAAPRLYSAGATKTCLESRPDSIAGLPPANPPVPPALFVYSFPPDRMPTRARGQLGVWYGKGAAGYEGIRLSFFKNVRDARASLKSIVSLYGGKLIRNVVVSWDQSTVPKRSLRETVLGCLRAKANSRAKAGDAASESRDVRGLVGRAHPPFVDHRRRPRSRERG